jgi:hypothetical protein
MAGFAVTTEGKRKASSFWTKNRLNGNHARRISPPSLVSGNRTSHSLLNDGERRLPEGKAV